VACAAAATLVAELGDITRFANRAVMLILVSFLPNTPAEAPDARAGSPRQAMARRGACLIEAAWSYRFLARRAAPRFALIAPTSGALLAGLGPALLPPITPKSIIFVAARERAQWLAAFLSEDCQRSDWIRRICLRPSRTKLTYAKMVNHDGKTVAPDLATFQARPQR